MGKKTKPLIIVILGPTGSGKTKISIDLAKKFNGEIISADSRQVYKFLDIGTDKIKENEMEGIKHHLLDIASPKRFFSVVQYQKKTFFAIKKIIKKEKTPFLVGGTGFYIQSITDNIIYPKTKKDNELRKKLSKRKVEELSEILKKLDFNRWEKVDKKNPIRLIRAIEIAEQIGKTLPIIKDLQNYQFLKIGIKIKREKIQDICERRFHQWIKERLIDEIKNLKKIGLSWQKIESFGLYYSILSQYIQRKVSKEVAFKKSIISLRQYIKKQITWFKKDKDIIWVNNKKEAEEQIMKYET